ncbi:MAG: RNA pseudouridine synthase [Proteobacteria bacterium]|nr:MAG: RNA pseudouridine synthase [Pseudomonadota bacterium]
MIYRPPQQPVDSYFSDAAILVVNKPAGLLSVPGRGEAHQDSLVTRLQAIYPDALTVHRLDMCTSGLMVFARGKAMERALSMQFQQRQVGKGYIALVVDQLAQSTGEINLPLKVDWPNRPRQMVDFVEGKPACTRYQVLHYDALSNTSRLQLAPITGRSHQLRVHLLSIGHPIIGDTLYAPPKLAAQAKRLLLHASELSFTHPVSGQVLHFYCPPDPSFVLTKATRAIVCKAK